MEKFDLSQIKAGYLMEVEDIKTGETFNMTVVPSIHDNGNGLGCCCPGERYEPLKYFLDGTLDKYYKILRVYGCTSNQRLLDNSTKARDLLWEREEPQEKGPKKMTVAEICEALGYDVEIVKEEKHEYKKGDRVRIVGTWKPGDQGCRHHYPIGEEVEVDAVLGDDRLHCVDGDGLCQIVHTQYVEKM